MSTKVYDPSELPPTTQELTKTLEEKKLAGELGPAATVTGGPIQTGAPAKLIIHRAARNETVIQNRQKNSFIILGEDRPAGQGTGWGAIGASPHSKGTNRIELTVGKMSRARNGKGAPAGTTADPSPFGDAAKIYIADMTNADTNFGFCGAQLGTVNANSAVVSFADQIRIFGLGGVQISTGHPKNAKGFGQGGITNCLGGTVPKAPPIVLSAGNQDGFYEHAISPGDGTLAQNLKIEMVPIIQGVAKGYNTTQCMVKLSEILDGILSALMRLSTFQGAFFATTSIQLPPPINPHIPAAANMMIQENFESFMTTLTSLRVEKQVWEATYTGFRAPKAIESPNVFTS